MAVPLVAARPVVGGVPRHTDLAGRGEDTPPSSPQLHEPLTFGRQRTPPRPLLDTTKRRQHSLQTLGGVATAARNRPIVNRHSAEFEHRTRSGSTDRDRPASMT